ncbi:hypothetical protein AL052_25545 [Pseudomonas amygdali pv. eriobotryae]|nr:hypothetical protein AL052_25545 [Pseudomonas amygdali pv. eriobotryae]
MIIIFILTTIINMSPLNKLLTDIQTLTPKKVFKWSVDRLFVSLLESIRYGIAVIIFFHFFMKGSDWLLTLMLCVMYVCITYMAQIFVKGLLKKKTTNVSTENKASIVDSEEEIQYKKNLEEIEILEKELKKEIANNIRIKRQAKKGALNNDSL